MNWGPCALSTTGRRSNTAPLSALAGWRWIALWQLVLVSLFLLPVVRSEEARRPWQYRGFSIDASNVAGSVDLVALRAATEEQIEIVCAVGLSPKDLAFVRSVHLRLVDGVADGTPGEYTSENRTVSLSANLPAFVHHGVLLHELMHAFHDQCLAGGFDNRDIAEFHARAKSQKAFPEDAYMLQDPREFFACAGNVFLYGVSGKEPFTRARLQKCDPELFAYLGRLFGPAAGHLAGSLATGLVPPAPAASPRPPMVEGAGALRP
jgi:hypothetical protein